MGYVALTMHLWTIASAIKGSSTYLTTVQTIVDCCRSNLKLDIDDTEPFVLKQGILLESVMKLLKWENKTF